jgi:hypothetical protein
MMIPGDPQVPWLATKGLHCFFLKVSVQSFRYVGKFDYGNLKYIFVSLENVGIDFFSVGVFFYIFFIMILTEVLLINLSSQLKKKIINICALPILGTEGYDGKVALPSNTLLYLF